MKKIKCIIIDDEAKSIRLLQSLLTTHCPGVEIAAVAENIQDGLNMLNLHRPDLLFLDIEMPYGSGFDLLNKIEDIDFEIVFVTAYESYALNAIRFCALDYILKPVNFEHLIRAVAKAEKRISAKKYNENFRLFMEQINMPRQQKKIALPTGNGFLYIPVEQIIRCESSDNYTYFYIQNQPKVLVSKTLKEYEDLLDEYNFFRIHNSHLINLNFVKQYIKGRGGQVVMADDAVIDVAQRRRDDFMERFVE